MNYHIFVILLAGGISSRTKSDLPKQFIKINQKYVAEYSILRFRKWFKNLEKNFPMFLPEKMIFVSHKDYLEVSKNLLSKYDLIFTMGGQSRHDSTKEGLKKIKEILIPKKIPLENVVVFIHDVARPIFLIEELNEVLNVILNQKNQTCISLAAPVIETVILYKEERVQTLNRKELYSVKTPQILSGKYLDLFLNQPTKETYTDLITWASEFNIKIQLVESIQENIKITYPKDFEFAKILLAYSEFLIDN